MPFDATISELRDLATRAYGKTQPVWDPTEATAIPFRVRLIAVATAIVIALFLCVWFAVMAAPLI